MSTRKPKNSVLMSPNKAISSPYSDPKSPIASCKREIYSSKQTTRSTVTTPSKTTASSDQILLPSKVLNLVTSSSDDEDHVDELDSNWKPSLFSPNLKYSDDVETDDIDDARQEELTDDNIVCSESESKAMDIAKTIDEADVLHEELLEDDEEGEEEVPVEGFNPYKFIKYLPEYSKIVKTARPTVLPPIDEKHDFTLVLDLDETLVHCSIDPILKPDFTFNVPFGGVDYKIYVRTRPFLQTFLEEVSKNLEVVVFTASQGVYAKTLLDILNPSGRLIHHQLYRDSCLEVEGNYLKDLLVLGRDLQRTVIIDNSPYAFGYQMDNGIPIESWFDCDEDTELLKLIPFLTQLRDSGSDVRPIIRHRFQTAELVACSQ